jgi:5-methylcytosine-specific restriction endonuclease McrA
MPVLVRCLRCGRLAKRSPCERCPRPSAHARGLGRDWARRSRAAIAAWVNRYGPTCPGYGRPSHTVAVAELTGDHRIPRARGGHDGPIDVLCRECNGRKGAR